MLSSFAPYSTQLQAYLSSISASADNIPVLATMISGLNQLVDA
jgi:hypothetical protein